LSIHKTELGINLENQYQFEHMIYTCIPHIVFQLSPLDFGGSMAK